MEDLLKQPLVSVNADAVNKLLLKGAQMSSRISSRSSNVRQKMANAIYKFSLSHPSQTERIEKILQASSAKEDIVRGIERDPRLAQNIVHQIQNPTSALSLSMTQKSRGRLLNAIDSQPNHRLMKRQEKLPPSFHPNFSTAHCMCIHFSYNQYASLNFL